MKRPGKNRPDLSGSSWNDDLHGCPLALTIDESTAVFGTRNQATVEAAEQAVPVSSDDVVHAIEHRYRDETKQDRRLPRPPELACDEQGSAAPADQPGAIRPKVRPHEERAQLVRIAAEALYRRHPKRA